MASARNSKTTTADAALDPSVGVDNPQASNDPPVSDLASVVPEEFRQYLAAAVWMPASEVRRWLDNPRRNEAAIPKVRVSLVRFGFVAPICIWTSRKQMVAGHTRLDAYEAECEADATWVPRGAPGPGLVPVRFHEFRSEPEAEAYALADNKLGEFSEWDEGKLASVVRRVAEADANAIRAAGYDDDAIASICRRIQEDDDRLPSDGSGEGGGDPPESDIEPGPALGLGVCMACGQAIRDAEE